MLDNEDLASTVQNTLTDLAIDGDAKAIFHILKPMDKKDETIELWLFNEDDNGEDVLSAADGGKKWAIEQVNKRRNLVEHVMKQIDPEKVYITVIPFYKEIVSDLVKGSDMETYLYNLSLDVDDLEISTTIDYDEQTVFICEYNPIKPL
jgi:hypothetical protein